MSLLRTAACSTFVACFLLFTPACMPSDTCQRDMALCMRHCQQEPAQAHDPDPISKYQAPHDAPNLDARSQCENSCKRCRKTEPQAPSKPPTPTGY